jgi:hypothetical protein
MLFYRKNDAGCWKTCKLTPEEAKLIQAKAIKIGLSLNKNMQEMIKAANLTVSDAAFATILGKVMPSYDSLANDMVEGNLAGDQAKAQ